MARITLRQLLDHAAEHDYGVPAFNINNMEQALAIMDAASSARRAGHHPGLARRPLLRQRRHAQAHDGRGHRDLSADPGLRASRPRQRARHLHDRDPGRLHLGDDGRLAEGRRQDAGRLGLQCRRHQDRDRHGPSRRHLGRGRARRARLARDRHGRQGRRPRRRGQALPRPAADQSRRGREVREGDQGSTRWPSRWAPRTAPTSSPASRTATSSP